MLDNNINDSTEDTTEMHTIKSVTFGEGVEYDIEVICITENNNGSEIIGHAHHEVGSWLWDAPEAGFVSDVQISDWIDEINSRSIIDDSGAIIDEEVTDEEDLFMTVLDFLKRKSS